MAYPRYGDYEAIVTDNSEFYKRGYIRVRISAFYNEEINKDLSQSYNDEQFKKSLKDDIRCLITMPMGGGNGHGMFSLPQVNSVGYVSFLNGDINKPIWKGAVIKPKYDDQGKFVSANIPNDRLSHEGPGSEGLTINGKQVESNGGAIIIRQKSTVSGSAEGMNWDNNRTENLVVISEERLSLSHAEEWGEENNSIYPKNYQEINIYKDDNESSSTYGKTIIKLRTVESDSSGNFNEYGLEIVDKKVLLKANNSSSKKYNEVSVDEDEIRLTAEDFNTKKTTSATLTSNQISLENKNSNITISEKEVNISGDTMVTLSGDEIRLGGLAEEYVVTSSIPFTYRMEDGTVLNSSRIAKA